MAEDREREPESPAHCGTGRTRLFVGEDLVAGETLTLSPMQSHHLVTVLRAKPGEPVLLFNGRDGEWQAEIVSAHKKAAEVALLDRTRAQPAPSRIRLFFAPVKRARLDLIVEKATEMGAGRLSPVITERTNVARLNSDRLAATAREAAEQCGLLAVPEIDDAVPLSAVIAAQREASSLLLFCDEWAPPGGTLAQLGGLKEMAAEGSLSLLVGPEGGFSPAEREKLLDLPGTHPLSLGPRILRAETGVIAALAAIQLVLGDWR